MQIYLRKTEQKDAALLAKWLKDKENLKYMSTCVRCREYTEESLKKEIAGLNPEKELYFMAVKKDSDKPIGHCGIDDMDMHDRRGELFFFIGERDEQGKGYGKEMIKLLLGFAFNELKLNSIFATATAENLPSVNALEKTGFKRIGIRRAYNYIGGKFLDEIFFDMTKEDYDFLNQPARNNAPTRKAGPEITALQESIYH